MKVKNSNNYSETEYTLKYSPGISTGTFVVFSIHK